LLTALSLSPTSTIIVHLKAKDLESAEKIAWKLKDAAAMYRKGEFVGRREDQALGES
jgi:hypothetical protein